MNNFKTITIEDVKDNFNKVITNDWMLITAGNREQANTMTASWGFLGRLWERQCVLIYIRPDRFTREFVERQETFTLAFFDEKYRKALSYCGSHTGRNEDKIRMAGLSIASTDSGTPYPTEARLVIECRKIYQGRIAEDNFIEPSIVEEHYPEKDFHYCYIGEIVGVYEKE
jgi:flavin reductase (DIM6/NTAB) family NADH-FMN oxidoreductase RutF